MKVKEIMKIKLIVLSMQSMSSLGLGMFFHVELTVGLRRCAATAMSNQLQYEVSIRVSFDQSKTNYYFQVLVSHLYFTFQSTCKF